MLPGSLTRKGAKLKLKDKLKDKPLYINSTISGQYTYQTDYVEDPQGKQRSIKECQATSSNPINVKTTFNS